MKMDTNALNNLTSAICALIEAMGMMAENKNREHRDEAPAYDEVAFNQLIYKHNLTGF
jgi:hypothetical protein